MILEQDIEKFSLINPQILRYLNQRLEEWAEWFSRKEQLGLGYPTQSREYKLMTIGNISRENPGPKPLPVNEAAEEMENIIRIMATQSLQAKKNAEALRGFYLQNKRKQSKCEMARLRGISEGSIRRQLNGALSWLAGWFTAIYGPDFIERLNR